MSTNEITYSEYWTEIAELAKSITEEARNEDREISEALHETIDSHEWVIYTARAMRVLCISNNDGYSAENFGVDSVVKDGVMQWSAMAFGAMYADVTEHSDFGKAVDDDDDDDDGVPPAERMNSMF